MAAVIKYREWEFEVDQDLTNETYKLINESGADTCVCNDCKNYVAYRDHVFPNEIKQLFNDLRIDYRKEVEVVSYEVLSNGLHNVGGWFHFKGKIINGKSSNIKLPEGGFVFDLTSINDKFLIGFAEGNDLTFFENKNGLIQVEFNTKIPWIINETENY